MDAEQASFCMALALTSPPLISISDPEIAVDPPDGQVTIGVPEFLQFLSAKLKCGHRLTKYRSLPEIQPQN
jgi:hypothetical protein